MSNLDKLGREVAAARLHQAATREKWQRLNAEAAIALEESEKARVQADDAEHKLIQAAREITPAAT